MRAWIFLAAAALVACSTRHDATLVEVRAADCITCHQADALAVVDPPHAGRERCADCHRTTAWVPALDGAHPDSSFPIATGAHQGIKCVDCHDAARGPSTMGGNTVCTTCHARAQVDGAHTGVPDYAFDDAKPSFCLTCHPSGRARRHEDFFPIRSGAHGGIACTDCHRPALGPYTGGANTDCVGCHTGRHAMSVVNGQHREVRNYVYDPANPHFCLSCHPRGRH